MESMVWSELLPENARERLRECARPGNCARVDVGSGGGRALLALWLAELVPRPWIWVTDGERTAEELYQDILTLHGHADLSLGRFPAFSGFPGQTGHGQPDVIGERLDILRRLDERAHERLLIVTDIQALMQPVPAPGALRRETLRLRLSDSCDPDNLARRLLEQAYVFKAEVQEKGDASRRGGILDVWPLNSDWPLRLEFFGDVLDSIRTFDPYQQTSIDKLTDVEIAPPLTWQKDTVPHRFDEHLDARAHWGWIEPGAIQEHALHYAEAAREAGFLDHLWTLDESERWGVDCLPGVLAGTLVQSDKIASPGLSFNMIPAVVAPSLGGIEPELIETQRRELVTMLGARAAKGQPVFLCFETDGGMQRFGELYGDIPGVSRIRLIEGGLSAGIEIPEADLTLVAESELYGYQRELVRRRMQKPARSGVIAAGYAAALEIQPGDLVIHIEHGLGKYLGLYQIEFSGCPAEVLTIEYAGGARLYVPITQAHLLSRYMGVGRRRPELHKLGGVRWQHQKEAAERAIRDMAGQLIETQAARETLAGHAFAADTVWQHEFEASFPYTETEDQHRAVAEVKRDMESPRPMDRLVCGDVGYGKTEIAMRAAFKAVMDGKQVAMLTPTTVLAQQHFDTFRRRMSAFPVTLEMLSRFRTVKEQREVIKRMAEGRVDIVIGTHRLVQEDIRFKNLGLVIIDEEQRFGVRHKERLKTLRQLVDVLTLTATPIPRTLYLSLTGARDMSTIQSPPRERLPVETIVTENNDAVVRAAILRELNREGQIFYLYNRVKTIHQAARRLRTLVPEARLAVAHGQMGERRLAEIMHRFTAGDIDLLLCTTIIESGVDIPNVNTILIERADRFGLSELYQLRGRVGRYHHQAYAYLLLPRHGALFAAARRRVQAIRRHSQLGAGFKIALRDLEIRGAGNLLGARQSGHIAAVGFELYCQLIKRTVARLKGEPPPPVIDVELKLDFIEWSPLTASDQSAAIPYDYIEDENTRLTLYRRLAAVNIEQEIDLLREELRDRFGPLPRAVDNLLEWARLRVVAGARGIKSITTDGAKIIILKPDGYLMSDGRFPRFQAATAPERIAEILKQIR